MMIPETDQEEKKIIAKIWKKLYCPNCGKKEATFIETGITGYEHWACEICHFEFLIY